MSAICLGRCVPEHLSAAALNDSTMPLFINRNDSVHRIVNNRTEIRFAAHQCVGILRMREDHGAENEKRLHEQDKQDKAQRPFSKLL